MEKNEFQYPYVSYCNFGPDYGIEADRGVVKIFDRSSCEVLSTLLHELRQDISRISVTNLDNKQFMVCYTFLYSEFLITKTFEVDSCLAITEINCYETSKNQVCSLVARTDENTLAVHYSDGEVKYFTLDKDTNECYEQIAQKEEKSSNNWRTTDSPTSPEDQKLNSAERVLKIDKDKE